MNKCMKSRVPAFGIGGAGVTELFVYIGILHRKRPSHAQIIELDDDGRGGIYLQRAASSFFSLMHR
ncbi:hypothetical protein K440DRAFT_632010 [Wilcoxina mikolae CBS 423.85]|nr:hypothetical protein K440DRAFT_632010 [Wilcoxina mikolae CBS 423.85]